MKDLIEKHLNLIGDLSSIQDIQPISGGDINEAYFVQTKNEQYFVKYNRHVPSDFFQKEADGLEKIRETNTICVPKVYYVSHFGKNEGILILEWIEKGSKNEDVSKALAEGVANMHQSEGDYFGLEEDQYIGTLPQANGLYSDWISFYLEKRLKPQFILAEQKGRLNPLRRKNLIKLFDQLHKWLPKNCKPVLLHGDLWGGNWISSKIGRPYLIDPAAFYGHYEFELAFTELFGGFSRRFYQTYQEILPLSKEYEERKELYQLYYLLVHLNLFGETYGQAVDRVLHRYIGIS